ncbi:helix-turn-helix domain-containing protein [Mediterraneibacter gnavus]|uniref:helix-turn-helix domain-containing protein n=1 Tax=Mediterraneibacter gnavus TaxID=33038 RepID=UPI0035638C5C
MTINERIKHFRKDILHLNQRQFAADLGMAQTGVSTMEQDGATITDRVIKSLCLAYNLNEDWLRDGKEPMYIQPPTFSLDDFVKQHGGTELEIDILKAYFELSPDVRKMLVQHFKSRLTASRAEPAATTVEEAEAAYIKSRSDTAQKTGLSASSSTADASRMESGSERASNL